MSIEEKKMSISNDIQELSTVFYDLVDEIHILKKTRLEIEKKKNQEIQHNMKNIKKIKDEIEKKKTKEYKKYLEIKEKINELGKFY